MGTGVPILSIAGIRIRAHWSVLLVAGLLAWGLAGGVIPNAAPSTPLALRWGLGIVAAFLLIVSLTAHELAHSLVARRVGGAVSRATAPRVGCRGASPTPTTTGPPPGGILVWPRGPPPQRWSSPRCS